MKSKNFLSSVPGELGVPQQRRGGRRQGAGRPGTGRAGREEEEEESAGYGGARSAAAERGVSRGQAHRLPHLPARLRCLLSLPSLPAARGDGALRGAGRVSPPVLREGGGGAEWPRQPPGLGKGFEVTLSPRLCPPQAGKEEAAVGGRAVCGCPERVPQGQRRLTPARLP